MPDSQKITRRVEGRKAANELTESFIEAAAMVKDSFGMDGAEVFWDTLRDNILELRPVPPKSSKPDISSVKAPPADESPEWDYPPDGFVYVEVDAVCQTETEKAYGFHGAGGLVWVPKSQLRGTFEAGDSVETLIVSNWFAQKQGWT